jgi:hypothetical protein
MLSEIMYSRCLAFGTANERERKEKREKERQEEDNNGRDLELFKVGY